MNAKEKPVGERLAALETWAENFDRRVCTELLEIKSLLNPKLEKVEQLCEWKRTREMADESRDRRLGRKRVLIGFCITVTIAAVQIILSKF